MTTANLTTEFETWCKANDLPCMDAMELLHASYCDVTSEGGVTMNDEQRKWLSEFIIRWDREQDAEDERNEVARKFAELLLRDLGAAKLDEVNRRNEVHARQGDGDCCSSQEFCDANMIMLEAMVEVLKTPEDMIVASLNEDEKLTALWNGAWDEAKANKFWRKP